jgi:branched-chain amino acid transport system substrate-binding protein
MKRCIFAIVMLATATLTSPALAADPVKLGFVYTFTGRQGLHGSLSKQGAELAIKEINKSGGLLGRQVEGVFEDDGGDAKKGDAAARKLVEADKVDAIVGVIDSGVALTISQTAQELRVPFIVTTSQTLALTGAKCNPYTFRLCRNTEGMIRTATALAGTLNVNEWTMVGPDYIFGRECWDLFKKNLNRVKPGTKFASDDHTALAPMTNTDWKPQIQKVAQSSADGIMISLYAGNLIDFLKQAREQGLFDGKRKVIALLGSAQTLMSLGVEMPEGVWVTPPYWFQASENPANQQFVSEYQAQYSSPPDYQAQFSYCAVKAYAAAVQRAGGTQKDAVAAAMEGLELDLPVGRVTIRKEDHQALFECFAGVTSSQLKVLEGRHRKVAYRPLERGIFFKVEAISPNAEESGCRMEQWAPRPN